MDYFVKVIFVIAYFAGSINVDQRNHFYFPAYCWLKGGFGIKLLCVKKSVLRYQ